MNHESLRVFACDTIQNASILLKLPQVAAATAQMLFHRVYYTPDYTFDKYPIDITAMAALFLAAKVEEYPRKAREIIDVFTYVISSSLKQNIVLSYVEFEKMKEELFTSERRLLKNLGFDLLSSYPHKIIISYYFTIVQTLDPEQNYWKEKDCKRLLQVALNYCNDSMRTDIFVRFSKETVACCCIQMACEDTKLMFPKSSSGQAWYELFIKEEELKKAMNVIRNLYNQSKPSASSIRPYIYISKY